MLWCSIWFTLRQYWFRRISLGLVFGVAWQQYANKKVSKKQELPPKN
jgi:hypothetical protein